MSPPPSPGTTARGGKGAVSTSHPLAARAGLHVLQEGGSAADAAVAMAAALTVVEPTSNGIGSDAFALVWAEDRLHGLDGSGRSPARLTAEAVRSAGHERMPDRGWFSVTVPGAPRAWKDLHQRFGRLSFPRVLAPAVALAGEGHPVPPVVARYWARGFEFFSRRHEPGSEAWVPTFAPGGRAPREGERVVLADHARTLQCIADSGADEFYEGALAQEMEAFAERTGGLLRANDLAEHRGAWVEPVGVGYRDAEVWEMPAPGQGVVALSALRMLDAFTPGSSWDDPGGTHAAVEAVKLAFADAGEHVGDPEAMVLGTEELLGEAYLASRRGAIGPRAEGRSTGLPRKGGTVLLVAADADGMMVSFIQSNYMGFGSGVVIPGTGIALQNRGAGFVLEEEHPNQVGPGKKPFHTIIPGFLFRDGTPWGPFGLMGGHMQPQGHVQVVRGLVDFGLPPEQVLALPRWHWETGLALQMEEAWDATVCDELVGRGHQVTRIPEPGLFGRGQIILREADGTYTVAGDPRADSLALAY